MFFFFPYSTDAPVYHWPFATIGLILANLLAFVGVLAEVLPFDPETGDPWILEYGAGLWPTQWICSAFMHSGIGHLLGNMLFLWVFGLIVEGKVGWLRFLLLYFAVAIGESAIEQTLMLWADGGGSLGASSAIFGLMAIAAVWAPDNEVNFAYFVWIVYVFAGSVGVTVLTVAALYVGWDLLAAVVFGGLGGGVSSSLLHLLGAAVGLPLGIAMVKSKRVDCEGWDFFSRYGKAAAKYKRPGGLDPEEEAELGKKAAAKQAKQIETAAAQVDFFLEQGNPAAAAKLVAKMATVGEGLVLSTPTLQKLIGGLQKEQRWSELAPLLHELIERSPETAHARRVQLAQVCVAKLDRPGRALELLGKVDAKALNEKQLTTAKRVAKRAREMQREGMVELDDGGW